MKKVLIIDDEKEVTDPLKTLIERKFKVSVLVANTGQQGYNLFLQEQENIGFIILDYILPDINGCDVLNMIKQIKANVPVMLCSGFDEFRQCEPDITLKKPFSVQKLYDILSSYRLN